jgi:hypothetical protein
LSRSGHLGRLLGGSRLEHFLTLKKRVNLRLSIREFSLGLSEFGDGKIAVSHRTLMQHFRRQTGLLLRPVLSLQGSDLSNGRLQCRKRRSFRDTSRLQGTEKALQCPPLLLQFICLFAVRDGGRISARVG